MSQQGGLGMPDIAGTVQQAILDNPVIKKVAAAVPAIETLKTDLTTMPEKAVAAVKTAAKAEVEGALVAAGVSPVSKSASGAEEATTGDESNNEGSSNTEEAPANEAANEEAPANESEEQSGGARYEIILLERPIQDRLFVCYEDGTPIYFTKNSKNKAKLFDPKKTTRRKSRR